MATEMQNVSDFGPLQSIVQRTVVQLLKEVCPVHPRCRGQVDDKQSKRDSLTYSTNKN